MELADKINMLKMLYQGLGKFTRIAEDIYGFFNTDNTVRLVNIDTCIVLEEAYNIEYIGKETIVMCNRGLLTGCGIILDRRSLKEVLKLNHRIYVVGDLVIAYGDIGSVGNSNKTEIYSLNGKKLATLDVYNTIEVSVTAMEYNNLYLIKTPSTEYENKHKHGYVIYKYYNNSNTLEKIWETNTYDIEDIGDDLYMFSDMQDYSNVHVYNFKLQKEMTI